MTTIAYRSGVLACDGRCVADDARLVDSDSVKKVFVLPDGSLFGGAGRPDQVLTMLDALENGDEQPKLDEVELLHVLPNGKVYFYEGERWSLVRAKYCACGSGAGYALSAMDAGADAIMAAKIGAKRDPKSGGRVYHVKLKGAE